MEKVPADDFMTQLQRDFVNGSFWSQYKITILIYAPMSSLNLDLFWKSLLMSVT